jgi:hypothetical protein
VAQILRGYKKIHEIFTTRGFFKTYYGKQKKYIISNCFKLKLELNVQIGIENSTQLTELRTIVTQNIVTTTET